MVFYMSFISYVHNIKTRILTQQGEKDERVSLHNSFELAYALKHLNAPYRFIVYKGQGHSFYYSSYAILQGIIDQLDWVKKYIKPYKR